MTRALTAAEVLALPAMVDVVTAGQALGGIGRTKAHELARSGEFPVAVFTIGRSYRVRRADLLDFLGIEEKPPQPSRALRVIPAGGGSDAA
jgi:Helix-turn-helix domain